jgi:uncharacterized membrane protein
MNQTNNTAVSQGEIIRKNISALAELQRKEDARLPLQERIAGWITDFSGSMAFVYIHAVWFGLWILLNVGLINIPHLSQFDPYPFGLLTLVVSLEAIFLSTFVLIAQNRLARQSERRAELDLQVNLLAEQKAAKILELLDQITRQLDQTSNRFNFTPDAEVAALKVSPEPQEVLQVIEEAVNEETEEIKQEVAKVSEEVSAKTGAVREDVEQVEGKVEEVTSDVERIKERITDSQ